MWLLKLWTSLNIFQKLLVFKIFQWFNKDIFLLEKQLKMIWAIGLSDTRTESIDKLCKLLYGCIIDNFQCNS